MSEENKTIGKTTFWSISIFVVALLLMFGLSMPKVNYSYLVGNTENMSIKVQTYDQDFIKLNSGDMYTTEIAVDVSSGDTEYIKANSLETIHLIERRIFATTTGNELDFTIKIFEGGTDGGASNILNNFNVNRNFPDNLNFNIYTNLINVDLSGATILPFSNSGVSDKKFSSMSTSTTDYILKDNTNYYMAITNNDGGTLTVNIYWQWYIN